MLIWDIWDRRRLVVAVLLLCLVGVVGAYVLAGGDDGASTGESPGSRQPPSGDFPPGNPEAQQRAGGPESPVGGAGNPYERTQGSGVPAPSSEEPENQVNGPRVESMQAPAKESQPREERVDGGDGADRPGGREDDGGQGGGDPPGGREDSG